MSPFDEHTVDQPAWADALVEVVRESMSPLGFIGHLGYRLWEPSSVHNPYDGWMLAVFPTPYERAGGGQDGSRMVSGFKLRVSEITRVFSQVEDVVWNNPVHYNTDLDGPELAIHGTIMGKRVLLRVYNLPPPDEPVSHVVDLNKGEAWPPKPEDIG